MSRALPLLDGLLAANLPEGTVFHPKLIDLAAQKALMADLEDVLRAAPATTVLTKTGGYTSAAITNCGTAGWWSDRRGYRYETTNPATGSAWPKMPESFLNAVALSVRGTPWSDFAPDACLINYYGPGARMGLHQDRDEKDFVHPIVTVCLGDDADFLVGGPKRGDKTVPVVVRSGDVMIMGGASRLYFHGIRKIHPGTSPLPGINGRYSLTFRKAL
jgi:alkylated DNA repair protein (DNA oxidative demethylase)